MATLGDFDDDINLDDLDLDEFESEFDDYLGSPTDFDEYIPNEDDSID